MVNASQKSKATQPALVEDEKKGEARTRPSLSIGPLEAAFNLAGARLVKFYVALTLLIAVVTEHATPERRAKVAKRVEEMQADLLFRLSEAQPAIDGLLDLVKAEADAALGSTRPKFISRTADALKDLGLDVDTAAEFIGRKQEGTPFAGDTDVMAAVLLEMGFDLPESLAVPADDNASVEVNHAEITG